MNRYEALSAPPSLKNKELSIHIRMQAGIPQETRNACSLELLNPKVKLTDELTTARFSRSFPESEPAHYRAMIGLIACDSCSEPIPYRFFAAEYNQTTASCGFNENTTPTARDAAQVIKVLEALEEAWRLQAWAAQFLRVAIASETQDPGKAGEVWDKALSFYRRFFECARVEESYAFQHQTDPSMRDACAAAWNAFTSELVRGIEARLKDYIRDKNASGIAACLDALGGREARSIDSDAYARALQGSFLPILSAIENAPNLLKAVELYSGCPAALRKNDEKHDLERSLLTSMGREAELLEKGFGDASLLTTWMAKLDARRLYLEGASTIKGCVLTLFENCRSYILSEIHGEKEEGLPVVIGLLRQMPPDLWIARQAPDTTGAPPTDLYRDDVLCLLLPRSVPGLISGLIPKGKVGVAKARDAGKAIWWEMKDLPKRGRFAETMQAVVAVGLNILKEMNAPEAALAAFLEAFPDDASLDSENVLTVGELKRRIAGDPRLKTLKALQQTECGSQAQLQCTQTVIKTVREDGGAIVQGERYVVLAQHALLNTFVGNANAYSDDPSRKLCRRIMEMIAGFLPDDTQVPGGEGKLTVRSLMDNLDVNQMIRAVNAAESGSQREMDAVRTLIRYVYDHPGAELDGGLLQDVAVKLLTHVFIGNANRVSQDSSASVSRDILDVIADFLPANTALPNEAGEKLTPWLLMARTDGISLLLNLRETTEGTDAEYIAVCRLISFLKKGSASFKLGKDKFEDIARNVLIQTLVNNANLFMQNKEGRAGTILITIMGYLPGNTPLPSSGGKLTVSMLIQQLGRMDLGSINLSMPNVPERIAAQPVAKPERYSTRANARIKDSKEKQKPKPPKKAAQAARLAAKQAQPIRAGSDQTVCDTQTAGNMVAACVRFVLWSLLIPFLLLCAAEYFVKASRTIYPLPAGSVALTGFLILWAMWLLGGFLSAAGDRTPFISRCLRWQLLLSVPPLVLMVTAVKYGFSPWEGGFRTGMILYMVFWWIVGSVLSASAAQVAGPRRPGRIFLKRELTGVLPLLIIIAILWRFGWITGPAWVATVVPAGYSALLLLGALTFSRVPH